MVAYRARNSLLSFVALAMILYCGVVPVVVAALADGGWSATEVLTQTIELIPFGPFIYQMVFNVIVGSLGGQVVSAIGNSVALSLDVVTQELAKGLFTVIIYEALKLVGDMLLGLKEATGCWNVAKKLLFTSVAALVAAYLSPLLMDYVFNGFGIMGGSIVSWASALLSVAMLGGGTLFYAALLGIPIIQAVLFVLVKFLLISAAKLVAVYAFLMVIIIGYQYQQYALVAEGVGMLFAVALILGGIELMVDSVFGA